MDEYPVMEFRCGTCSRNRYIPMCLGGHSYCRISGKQTDGTWLPSQPRPDEPCDEYNPSRGSIVGRLLDWKLKKQERKEKTVNEAE